MYSRRSSAPLSSRCEGSPLRSRMTHEPWSSWRKVTSMMTFRTPANWKSMITRSAFFSPRLCGTFLRSVRYPALVNNPFPSLKESAGGKFPEIRLISGRHLKSCSLVKLPRCGRRRRRSRRRGGWRREVRREGRRIKQKGQRGGKGEEGKRREERKSEIRIPLLHFQPIAEP
jgi:hypothetical protein